MVMPRIEVGKWWSHPKLDSNLHSHTPGQYVSMDLDRAVMLMLQCS